MYDLRSDTVTRPSEGMRRAMAAAEVGDDVYREDPTVRRLEERTAAIVGQEAALFVPSGTMANQIALLCHCRAGDEAIVGKGTHCLYYESGAAPAWSGIQLTEVGDSGLLTAEQVAGAVKPRAYYCPRTSIVILENTHNRGGGRVLPQDDVEEIAAEARKQGLALHLDGARIWNAAVATGRPVAELTSCADTVSVCFSKGLGAPVGSAICGSEQLIEAALRFRRMLGGAMRQAGILAAGALYALEHHREGLEADHEAARSLGQTLNEIPGVSVMPVETNIVNVSLAGDTADQVVAAAERHGVLIAATGPRTLRLVTHRDVTGTGFAEVLTALHRAVDEALGHS